MDISIDGMYYGINFNFLFGRIIKFEVWQVCQKKHEDLRNILRIGCNTEKFNILVSFEIFNKIS